MKVVILCGGLGTRIRDVSDTIPKPMIPIGNLPILWHIMKYFSSYGHRDFVLCLGYKGSVIKEFFLNYRAYTEDFTISFDEEQTFEFHGPGEHLGWRVTLVDTGLHTMTGGRIAMVKRWVDTEDFFLTYGDGVGDVDLDGLLSFHRSHGKTLTVTGVRPPGRFGELSHMNGVVSHFNEKPQTGDGLISGGYFVAKPSIFESIGVDMATVFEAEPIAKLVSKKELMAYEHKGFWHPMDTSREYLLLNKLYSEGNAPWVRW